MQTSIHAAAAIILARDELKPKLLAIIEAGKGETTAKSDCLEGKLSRYGGCRLIGPDVANELQRQLSTTLGLRGDAQRAACQLEAQETYFAPGAGRLRDNLTLHPDVMNAINENRAPNNSLFNPHKSPWQEFNSFWEANEVRAPQPRQRRRLSETRPMPPITAPAIS